MPATTITIDRDQREGLYELVRNHLGGIGAVGVSVICGEAVGFWGAAVGAVVGGAIGFLSATYNP